MILASRLELSFLLTPASRSWTGHRLVPGGPSKMGDCQAGWLVYNGGNPLKGVGFDKKVMTTKYDQRLTK